jgi:hypothetical protein
LFIRWVGMSSYSWPPDGPFEYRAMERYQLQDGTWSKWSRLGNRLAYPTMGSVKSFVTKEKRRHQERAEAWPENPPAAREWKIQRRPVDAWEDIDD